MKLYIFVEGIWDSKFFNNFLKKVLDNKFDEFECVEFAENRNNERKEIKRIVESNRKFIFCPDLDSLFSQAKTNNKILEIAEKYLNLRVEQIQDNSYMIVQKIESWYLAGFGKTFCNKKNIDYFEDTELVTKGTFKLISKKLKIDTDRFKENLIFNKNNYSIVHAKTRNKSFENFCNSIGI